MSEVNEIIRRVSKAQPKSSLPTRRGVEPPKGNVPEGDARLSVNIRMDRRDRLKDVAHLERTTMGELLEYMIDNYLDQVRADMREDGGV